MSARRQTRLVEQYLNRRYPIVVRKLSPEEGGGYTATIPQLGSRTFVADGETPADAIDALDSLRRHLIPELLAEGVELPEPREDPDPIEQYSGNLVLRIPKSLHAQLAATAKQNGCSLNKYATQLLAQNLEREWWVEQLRDLSEPIDAVATPAPRFTEPTVSGSP
jgi:predicted RNase H-like HicB family nuclease